MSDINVLKLFAQISVFVFDVDGVLTDGNLLVMPGGHMIRRMNIKDGYALQLAVKKKFRVLIISGGNSPEVKERLNKLGVDEVFMNVENKETLLSSYIKQHNLNASEVLFMGDDIPDYKAMQLAGLACCPSDAAMEIKKISQYISHFNGGTGCARDVIEKVLKLKGCWGIDAEIKSQ